MMDEVEKPYATMVLPSEVTAVAPDGSHVRVLLTVNAGSMAHFELRPGATSVATRHRTISELWYFIEGRGHMWRKADNREGVVDVYPGVCISIPMGTEFQFRSCSWEPLAAVGVTMPPWPGEGEAVLVDGPWPPTVEAGPH
jgi:mannose-6-phosphate isomerase-like protein (cupin superfamily)